MHGWVRPVALVAVLALATLAGCASNSPDGSGAPAPTGTPSASQYAILPPAADFVASTSDGKLLENAVYRPDVPNGTRVPVFINFSPYWGDTATKEGDAFSKYMIHEYVPRGYAVVLSSVRGTGHSAGCFQIGGDLELRDAYDVVDHFAHQDWSNGNIGAGGKSYDSTTQNGMVAKYPHPALKTIFHVSGITDMYRYNYHDGVAYQNGIDFTPRYYASQGLDEYAALPVLGTGGGGPQDESPESVARLADDAACPEMPKHATSGPGSAVDGVKDAYWQERDWVSYLPKSAWNGSVFFVHGLQDWNVKSDNIEPWVEELQAHGNPVLGWLHQWQQAGTGHVYPMRTDWNATLLAWLDHYLKGVDNGIEAKLGFEAQGTDMAWRYSPTWPPQAKPLKSTINTGKSTGQVMGFGPFPETRRLAGMVQVDVTATGQTADPVLRATLWTVNGTARTFAGEAAKRVIVTDDLTQTVAYVPGTQATRHLASFPLDVVLTPGMTLEVDVGITAADLAGADPANPTGPSPATPPGFVFLPGQDQVTYTTVGVTLPFVDATPLALQPVPMRCFTC